MKSKYNNLHIIKSLKHGSIHSEYIGASRTTGWDPVMTQDKMAGIRHRFLIANPNISYLLAMRSFLFLVKILRKGGRVLIVNRDPDIDEIIEQGSYKKGFTKINNKQIDLKESLYDLQKESVYNTENKKFHWFLLTNQNLSYKRRKRRPIISSTGVRWVGGTITNWGRISKMVKAHAKFSIKAKNRYSIKEEKRLSSNKSKIYKPLQIRDLSALPSLPNQRFVGTPFATKSEICVTNRRLLPEGINETGDRDLSTKRLIQLRKKGSIRSSAARHFRKMRKIQKKINLYQKAVESYQRLGSPSGLVGWSPKQEAEAILFINPKDDKEILKEALNLRIPVAAFIDATTDPRFIRYPIPLNNDSPTTIYSFLFALFRWFSIL